MRIANHLKSSTRHRGLCSCDAISRRSRNVTTLALSRVRSSRRCRAFLVLSVFFLVLQSSAAVSRLGDLDEDGKLTILDLVRLLAHYNGTRILAPTDALFADLNQDGAVNELDASIFQDVLLGRSAFPDFPLLKVRSSSPAAGEQSVAVTRETVFYLTLPLAAEAIINTDVLFATFGGRKILSRVEVSSDRKTVTLFYLEPLPSGARVRVRFAGATLRDFLGRAVDLDGDGLAGGNLEFDFDTVSTAAISGTVVIGRVFASEMAFSAAANNQPVNRPLAGVTITVDGQEESMRAVTDANGNFRLDPAPAGPFFVHIDGRTIPGSGFPSGNYYPTVGKLWESQAGEEVSVGNIYLPLIRQGTLQQVSQTQPTVVTFPADVVQANPDLQGVTITVPPNSLFNEQGNRGGRVGIAPVAPDRLPSPLPPGLDFSLVITVQTDGAGNFDQPVPVCFPNLPDRATGRLLEPGEKSALWSFNHDLGDWEIVGSMTVSADGKLVCSDPGVGILQPGWHGTQQGTMARGGETQSGGGPSRPREKGTQHAPKACPSPVVPCPPNDGDNGTDPIHLFSGEFYEEVIDMKIPGRGFDFIWSRMYRSRNGRLTEMGHHWEWSYNVFVRMLEGDIVLNDGGGREDVYPKQADGTWSQREFFRQFTQLPNGTIVLTFEDRGSWEFYPLDSAVHAGRLKASIDRHGNAMRFVYDAQGRLGTIIDTLDREIKLAYTAQGLISSVTDFAGRSVRYEYYDGIEPGGNVGDLKSVTTPAVMGTPTGNDFPNGKRTTYTYTTGFRDERLNRNLLTITDGRRNDPNDPTYGSGPYVVNIYDPTTDPNHPNFDRVVQQIWGGQSLYLTYVPVLPSAANGQVLMRAILQDREGFVHEYFFDQGNRVVRQRDFTGRANRDLATTANGNRPAGKVRAGDPEFFETINEWTEDSLLRRTIHPNGNITERVYEADLNPRASQRTRGNVRVVRRLPGAHVPAGDQTAIEERFEYDTGYGSGCCGFNFVTRVIDARGTATEHFYDARGNRIRTIYRDRNAVEEWEFNSFGQVVKHVLPANASGHRRRDVRVYYDSGPQKGYVRSEILDEGGLNLTVGYEYDAVGNRIRIIDALGRDTRLEYNALNQIVREHSPEVRAGLRYQRDYYYDANDNLTRLDIMNVNAQGAVGSNRYFSFGWEYESLNYPIRVTSEVSESETIAMEFEYDGNRNRVLMRSGEASRGTQPENITRWEFDERNQLYRSIHAPASATARVLQYDYDGNSNPIRITVGPAAQGRVTAMTFDGYNRLIAATDPMGNVTRSRHDANGNEVVRIVEGELVDLPGSSLNVRLSELRREYDAMDREVRRHELFFDLATQQMLTDGTASYEQVYAPDSQLIRVVNDHGRETRFGYDTANRMVSITDPAGNVENVEYDASGNVLRRTTREKSSRNSPDLEFVMQYTYDALDRLIQVRDSGGNITDFGYDSRNNRTFALDPARGGPTLPGNRTEFVYDGLSRLVRTIRTMTSDGTGAGSAVERIETSQEWDANSRLIARVDGKGNRTRYEHDAVNRLSRINFPDGTQSSMEYDAQGNPVLASDQNGTKVAMVYDTLNRVTRKTVTPGTGVAADTTFEAFQYDGTSRLVRAQSDGVEVLLSYDSLGHMIVDSINGRSTRMTYDGAGNLRRVAYPGGRVLGLTYDELERLKTISDESSASARLVAAYDYSGPNRVEQRQSGNSTRLELAYDSVGRVARTTHRNAAGQPVDSREYQWDSRSNKTLHRDLLAAGSTQAYEYDSINRLTRTVFSGTGERAYRLDAAGNRTAVSGVLDAGNYSMAAAPSQDAAMNQYTITPFDARSYDENGNLVRAESQGEQINLQYDYRNRLVRYSRGGETLQYVYDPLGRRIARSVADQPAGTVRFSYFGWSLIEEQNAAGQTLTSYVRGRSIDEVISLQAGGQEFWLHGDDLGSIRRVTDNQGNVVERYEYDDFGAPVILNAANAILAESQVGNPFLFTGLIYDSESGLYQARYRYYEPRTGRFITRDPLGAWADSLSLGNAFTYAGNNPAAYTDPFGLWSLGRWILTGDGNAADNVYEDAKTQFRETLWDRTDATVKTITAGHADALSVVPPRSDRAKPRVRSAGASETSVLYPLLGDQDGERDLRSGVGRRQFKQADRWWKRSRAL
jgi:RHS repeat-associated protein